MTTGQSYHYQFIVRNAKCGSAIYNFTITMGKTAPIVKASRTNINEQGSDTKTQTRGLNISTEQFKQINSNRAPTNGQIDIITIDGHNPTDKSNFGNTIACNTFDEILPEVLNYALGNVNYTSGVLL